MKLMASLAGWSLCVDVRKGHVISAVSVYLGPDIACGVPGALREFGGPRFLSASKLRSSKRPSVGFSQVRSWSHWFVLGAILWAFIAKS